MLEATILEFRFVQPLCFVLFSDLSSRSQFIKRSVFGTGRGGGLKGTWASHFGWPCRRTGMQIIQVGEVEASPAIQGQLEAESVSTVGGPEGQSPMWDDAGDPGVGLQGPVLLAWYPRFGERAQQFCASCMRMRASLSC